MKRLSREDISVELVSFLDSEGQADNDESMSSTSDMYFYQRGAVEFAEYLRAACTSLP